VLNPEDFQEFFGKLPEKNLSLESHKSYETYGLQEFKAIEVGNIFKLGTKYSQALGLNFTDKQGRIKPVIMGSYGIAPSRSMGTVVELFHDENGIIWPQSIAPFKYHILCDNNFPEAIKHSIELYNKLVADGNEVLLDDREETIPVKIKDSDLIGCPIRVVVSKKSLEAGGVEVKNRNTPQVSIVSDLN
jgi:prolyl-tRNA synthetase